MKNMKILKFIKNQINRSADNGLIIYHNLKLQIVNQKLSNTPSLIITLH